MSLVIDYSNKIVLVTGVSSGIGRGTAIEFSKAGAHIVGCSRKPAKDESIVSLRNEIESHNVQFLYTETDVTISSDLEHMVEEAVRFFNRIDVLVSNAGVNIFKGTKNCSDDSWEYNMNLNLKSHWKLAQYCKPHLEKQNGVILIMTSNHAYYSIPGCFPYNITKTALNGLVCSLSIEWGPKIRTVGIAPGFIDTAGNDRWFNGFPDPAAERQRTIDLHPVKAIGTVEEVGNLCVYLASPLANFISGTTILMDGGRSALMQDS